MFLNSKILVVDDDKLICSYIEDALLSRGFKTYVANNIQEAKRIVKNEQIELLITDLQMKGGTGIDLIRYFRRDYPTIPSIVITAFPGEDYVKVMEEMEVDTFLTKPFSADQIRYSVMKGLEKRNRHIESLEIRDRVMTNGNLGLLGTSQYLFELRRKIRNFEFFFLSPYIQKAMYLYCEQSLGNLGIIKA